MVGAASPLLLTPACIPPCGTYNGQALQRWSFEQQLCDGDPTCGFTTVSGSAEQVPTFTEGEHGLQLTAGTEIEQSLDVQLNHGPEYLGMLARCDAGTSLRAEVVLNEFPTSTSGSPMPPRIRLVSADFNPGTEWSNYNETLLDGQTSSPDMASRNARAVHLRITVVGTGTCTLDDMEFGSRYTYACY